METLTADDAGPRCLEVTRCRIRFLPRHTDCFSKTRQSKTQTFPSWEKNRKYCRTTTDSLAPSPRIIALLARRGRMVVNPTMALTEVPQPTSYPPLEEKKPLKEPPPVVVTPCDPWPRPYYLENGLRRVAPYHFTYNTYCKERWRGRELLDIFASEFRDRPLEYYVSIPAERGMVFTDRHRKMP